MIKKSDYYANTLGFTYFSKKANEFFKLGFFGQFPYLRAVRQINKELVRRMIQEDEIIELPSGLGKLYIQAVKLSEKQQDYIIRKRSGFMISEKLRERTGGYYSKHYWSKDKRRVAESELYSFKATQDNRQAAQHIIKEQGLIYTIK